MNFTEVLREIVEKIDGAVSAIIVGTDGMSVEEYSTEKLIDLTGLSAESSAMIRDINLASKNLKLGEAHEFSIISDTCGIIMRRITPEYYLALVLKPGGNYGKGRFILKTTIPQLESEF